MILKIEDMKSVTGVENDIGIEIALSKRYGSGVNEFWISHEGEDYPALAVVVNGGLASISYVPEAGSPGFKSVGDSP